MEKSLKLEGNLKKQDEMPPIHVAAMCGDIKFLNSIMVSSHSWEANLTILTFVSLASWPVEFSNYAPYFLLL